MSVRDGVSQRAFVRLLARGIAYQAEAPTMWDVDFQTAVAQAEIEDREIDGAYHRIRFDLADGLGLGRSRNLAARADPGLRRARRESRRRPVPVARWHDGRDAAVRRRDPDRRPRAGRSREGDRGRDDLHLRRHHRRHMVARAEAPAARDRAARRHDRAAPMGRAGWGSRDVEAAAAPRPSSPGSPRRRLAPGSPGCCAESGDLIGEPKPVTARREVLRERASGRSRWSRAGSGSSGRSSSARNCSSAGASSAGTPRTWARATRRGSRG